MSEGKRTRNQRQKETSRGRNSRNRCIEALSRITKQFRQSGIDSSDSGRNHNEKSLAAGGWRMVAKIGRIYKSRGDRWRIRLPGRTDIYCDKQHETFYSRQHAERTLIQIQGEIQNGTFDPDFYSKTKKSIHSFEVYAREWLDNCEARLENGTLSPSYLKELRRFVNKLFIPAFRNMNIAEIKGKDLTSFHLKLKQSPKTVFNIMAVLHKIFVDAYRGEVIQRIPNFPIEFKLSELPEPPTNWVSEEIQDDIFHELAEEDYFFIFFQATHATRTGETRALQHQDIDLKNDTVTIRRSFSLNKLWKTKTKRIRVIPLDLAWKQLYLERPRSLNPEEFVFLRGGKPFSESWARKKWNEARKKAQVAGITLYEGTRHSLASQAVNRGANIYFISKFLGHTNIKQTERYAKLLTEPLKSVQRTATVHRIGCAKGVQKK
jgi:integrase